MRGLMLVVVGLVLCCEAETKVPSIRALNGTTVAAARLDAFLAREMTALGLPGLSIAVINDDRVVYHRALGVTNVDTGQRVTNDTLFDAGSMSKTPFAFLTLKLAERGVMNLDTPLHTYLPLPELAHDERYRQITARMVLSHTSGLPNWRFLNPDKRLDIKFTPGSKYLYSGEGFEYLANVVAHREGVAKNDLQALFAKEVAAPFGWQHATYTWNAKVAAQQANGHVNGKVAEGWGLTAGKPDFAASYSLQAEAAGYARFIIAMMRRQGLDNASYDEMLAPRVKTDVDDVWYGLGIMVKPTTLGNEYRHDGYNLNFSSGFMFNAERRFGYVFFTNCERGDSFGARLESLLAAGKEG